MPDKPASYIAATGAVHPVHIIRSRFSLSLNSFGRRRDTTLRGPSSNGRVGLATCSTGRLQGGAEPITLPAATNTWAVARMLSRTTSWHPAATKPTKLSARQDARLFSLFSAVDRKRPDELMQASDVPADDTMNYGNRLPPQQYYRLVARMRVGNKSMQPC